MTPEEIVKRLRYRGQVSQEAADLIEQQAKALDEAGESLEILISYGCPACGADCSAANPPTTLCPMRIAAETLATIRAARGGKE